jgi:Tol biopolymer transport system component
MPPVRSRFPQLRSRRRFIGGLVALVLVGLSACSSSGGSSAPERVPLDRQARKAQLAFVSDRAGQPSGIWLASGDGNNAKPITQGPGRYANPGWSPDGQVVIFDNDGSGNFDVWSVNADGSNLRQLTTDPASDGGSVWSPDGQLIAFFSDRGGGFDLWVMNADGSGQRQLTDFHQSLSQPAWSPDGQLLAFTLAPDANSLESEVWTIGVDGSGAQNLTNTPRLDADPAWSPDGRHIAFTSQRETFPDVFVMNANGTNVRNLTKVPNSAEQRPVWSPEGRRIAFQSTDTESRGDDIFVMDADGTHVRNVTNTDEVLERQVRWAPGGRAFAFTANIERNDEVLTINVDRTGITRISRNPGADSWPAWRPRADT